MLHDISPAVMRRMSYLESIDAADRKDGTQRSQRLRQITPETGRFIALLAASAPQGELVEIGTSGGYSTLWLALACRETDRVVTTFEADECKARLARETFRSAGVEDVVQLVAGDARDHLHRYHEVSFCFLDAEKEDYLHFYETVIPNVVSGGFLVADNAISHRQILTPILERALNDKRVDALIVPIGKGELVCRKI